MTASAKFNVEKYNAGKSSISLGPETITMFAMIGLIGTTWLFANLEIKWLNNVFAIITFIVTSLVGLMFGSTAYKMITNKEQMRKIFDSMISSLVNRGKKIKTPFEMVIGSFNSMFELFCYIFALMNGYYIFAILGLIFHCVCSWYYFKYYEYVVEYANSKISNM